MCIYTAVPTSLCLHRGRHLTHRHHLRIFGHFDLYLLVKVPAAAAHAEREDARKYGIQDLAETLLPVLDNFERTVKALSNGADVEAIMQGVGMIEKQLRTALEGAKVQRISAVGAVFDPELHEALGTVVTDEFEPNVVVEELEPGYRLHDRVIRPARVRVAQGP